MEPGVDSGGTGAFQPVVGTRQAGLASPTGSPRVPAWSMVESGTPPQGSFSQLVQASSRSSVPLSSSPPITGSPQMSDKANSAEQVQLRVYWLSFIKSAGIDKEYSVFYASIFVEHELDGTMLNEIDHSLLVSLGVKKAGHRIKIIRFARLKLAAKKNPSLIPTALHGGKPRSWPVEDKDAGKKRSNSTITASSSMRRARSNSKDNFKRTEVQKTPGTSPLPRRESPTIVDGGQLQSGSPLSDSSPLAARRDQEQTQLPLQSEEEEEYSESESSVSDSSSDSDSDLDFDFANEEEATKMIAAMRSRYKRDSSKEKLSKGQLSKSKKTDSSKNLATSLSGTKDDPSVRTGSFTGGRPDEDALNEYDAELADEQTDLSQYHEIKFFFNLEPTKRYLESTKEITGREFTETVCQNLKKEPGSIVVFTVNDNGEFVPLKEDDFIIRSEMHYVIESRKVSKDIKKLKERLKKEKPIWDSDNWPLMVDFVDSKDIYMAEHGRIGLCMCPGRKKRKKRHVWARDQYKDLDRLQQVYSCDVLVTLVREQELRDLRIEDLFDEVKKRGMQSLYLPIKDKWIPKSTHRLIDLVEKILSCLRKGKTVVVHCNGGKGRSATVIVACLIALGQSIPHAIKILQRVRKGTIRNPLQQAYLRKFLSEWTAAQKTKQRKKSIIALTSSSNIREADREAAKMEMLETGDGHLAVPKDGGDDELGSFPREDNDEVHSDADPMGMLASGTSPAPTSLLAPTMSGDFYVTSQGDVVLPGPPSSEGEDDKGADRIRWDSADYGASGASPDEREVGDDVVGHSDDASSGAVPTILHLTPLEKKLMKVQKLIKKTEKRILKKESMIAKEKHHLDDLRAELKRVSAELKKEMQEGGSYIKHSGKTEKLGKSGPRSPGPVRRGGGDGIEEDRGDSKRDGKDRGKERGEKEKERKERKEKKEKEKEDRRKEREEKERERREKEREKREKGREERERKEKEKEERKEKKKEEKLLKKKYETTSSSGSRLRSREGSNADLSIDYVAAASAALEAAELPLPTQLVERPQRLSSASVAPVVDVSAKDEETKENREQEEKPKGSALNDGGDGDDDEDDGTGSNILVDVSQSMSGSTSGPGVLEEESDGTAAIGAAGNSGEDPDSPTSATDAAAP